MNKCKRTNKRGLNNETFALMSAIIFIALLLRLTGITWESLWLDEAMTGLRSQMNLWDMIEGISGKDHLPLYFTSIWGLEKITGNSEMAIRLPSAILGGLTVIPMYFLGSRISKRTGVFAALLTALNPSFIYFSQEARMYAPMAFLAAFSIFFSLELVKPRRITIKGAVVGLIIANSLLIYLHYLSSIFIAVETLSIVASDLILNQKRAPSRSILKMVPNLTSFLMFLPWLIFILIRYPISGHTTGGGMGLSIFFVFSTYLFLGGVHRFYYDPLLIFYIAVSIVVLLITGYGIFLMLKRSSGNDESKTMAVMFLPIIIIPVIVVYLISICWQDIFNYRYFIFMMPAVILMASLGMDEIYESISVRWKKKRYLKIIALLVLPLLLLTADAVMMDMDDKPDWRGATRYINENLMDDDLVIPQPAHQRYSMYYYVPDLPIRSISENPENVTELFESHDVIWVITADDHDIDYYGFYDLLENRTMETIKDYNGLIIWRFSK